MMRIDGPKRVSAARNVARVVAIALVLVACGGDAGSDDDPADTAQPETTASESGGGELVVSLPNQPSAIDPVNAPDVVAGNVAWQMFDALAFINEDGEIEPALAESWEVSEDGRTYTFTLRQGVTFHNGEPFNADAVVFTWNAGKNPENYYFDTFELASNVEAIDEFTVAITTDEPNALFLSQVAASWPMFPPGYYEEVGLQGFAQAPMGTGAFQFVEWVQGDRIVLEAFEGYWREGYPKIDRVVFRPIPESSTRAAAIRTGDVDIVSRLTPEEAATLEAVDGVEVVTYANNRVYYIAFNNLTSGVGQPTEDPLVRQALNHAVDKQSILDALFAGTGRVPTALLTPGDVGYDDAIEAYAYDPDRARELLAEAGYADGFDMEMSCPSDAYTNFVEVCEAVAAQLTEVGVNVSLGVMESGAYWDLQAEKQLPPMFGDSWSANSNEASAYDRLFGALGGEGASFSAWSDPEIDRLMGDIIVTLDDGERASIFTEIHRRLHEDPPFIYLYEPETIEAITDRVENYRPRSAEDYWLWAVELAG
ncbi:MAG: ABC transporter substrate-binding protein [Acidimicrobiia bacterium]